MDAWVLCVPIDVEAYLYLGMWRGLCTHGFRGRCMFVYIWMNVAVYVYEWITVEVYV
jgi:hypothetical protein